MTAADQRSFIRILIGGTALLSALFGAPSGATAQTWPERPMMLTLPYPPGGTNDTEARIVTQKLPELLGQPIIIQSKPGATGAIATEFVARSQPDGYNFLFASSAQTAIVPAIQKVKYTLDDLMPVSAVVSGGMVLAINKKVPATNLKEWIDLVHANPGKYNYASGGAGSIGHLVGALFVARAKLDMLHVPYRGGGPAVIDLMSGQVAMYFGNAAELMPHVDDERIRIIAVSSLVRMKQLPDIPAIAEIIPGFELTGWRGFMAPAGTPKPIIDKLSGALQRLSKDPEVIDKLGKVGVDAITTTPAQHAKIIHDEIKIYAEAIAAAGIKHE